MSPAGGDQRRDRRGKNGSALGRFLTFLACAAGAAGLFLTGVAAGIWFSMPVPEAARASVPHAAAAVPAAAPTSPVAAARPSATPTLAAATPPPSTPPVPAVSAPRASQSPSPPPVATATWVPLDRRDDHRPLIAIVIDDMGVARRRSDRAAALPGPLTLAFLPYAENVARQSHAARRRGHEIWVHIPMQPMGFNSDPGPNVLDARLGAAEMRRRLMWNLTRFDGYVGFNNHMGSRLTANRDAMDQVMTAAGARGLMFLDSLTTNRSVAYASARAAGLPATTRDVFLDNTDLADEVMVRLAETEARARARGSAVAIGHPRDATLDVLEPWLATVEGRGFRLAPLSAVILKRQGRILKQVQARN